MFIHPSLPSNLEVPLIEYHVITESTAQSKLKENPVYVAVTWEEYLELSKFERDKLSYVEKLHIVIENYKSYIDSNKEEEDEK